MKSFSIDSRRAFICAATLARDLNSCSAVSQRQCERARRSRTRHSGRYISCHGAKREPASRNTTRKTQCKTARSSRRPACLARAVRGLFACLGASQCYLEHRGGEVVAIFAFFSRLHFAGEEEVPRILAFRRAQQARKRCMRCDAAGRLPRASSGPGQYGRQRRRSSMGRDCSLPSLAFRSQVCSPPPCPGRPIRMPAGASWAVRRLLRLAARG